ncbi:MAG TPA: GatB/YqeY domain-containing protein [Solirubrobacteraceae bacterium]|nr:GatB/YqeY domain-containing protein [Solirubrobacteraceae bacterium]
MAIADQIKRDVTTALKAGDRDRVGALRLVLSELQKAAKEGGGDEQAVLRRERKRRRESEAAFRAAGRAELAQAEAYEAGVIEAYLPAELGDAELDALVAQAIEETGAEGPRDMGKAIQHVMAAAGGRADGKRVSTKVKEALS